MLSFFSDEDLDLNTGRYTKLWEQSALDSTGYLQILLSLNKSNIAEWKSTSSYQDVLEAKNINRIKKGLGKPTKESWAIKHSGSPGHWAKFLICSSRMR